MKKLILTVLIALPVWAAAEPRQVDEYHWTGVGRIVAIGDLHGDYERYLETLRAAGLIDRRDRWAGGETHLVQTGDIPDRGPDTAKIIEHIDRLAREAKRKGGAVHLLLGNHEAMNVYGDLRYVSEGEYAAFADRNSRALRDRYFEAVMQDLQQRDPEGYAALPDNYREEWDREHPLGWVEHRQSWDPRWNPDGEYARRALDLKVAIQVNDIVFVHGGISGLYCQNSLASLTEEVMRRLDAFDPADTGPIEDDFGPLWYRGLSGRAPAATPESVQAVLDRHQAQHIVVGHTPTGGVIWPRYDGRVIHIDTGISEAYGGHVGYFEATSEGLFGGYPGGRVPLPETDDGRVAYLQQVIELNPDNAALQQRLTTLQTAAASGNSGGEGAAGGDDGSAAETAGDATPAPVSSIPTCGIYP